MADSKVVIIIVTYNAEGYIYDCLNSLKAQRYPEDQSAVFVIDNNSQDNTVEIIKKDFPNVKLIINKNNDGFAEGNNIGIRLAINEEFDYIYLLNQDTIVEPDFLTEAITAAEADRQIGAVQSKMLLWPEKDKVNSLGNAIHYLGFGYSKGYQQANDPNQYDWQEIMYPSGAAVLLRVDVLKRVGLFDGLFFMYHEDLDLGWRLRLAGYKIILAPKSVIYHKYEFSKSIKKYFFMERNRFIVLLTNYRLATLLFILPALLIMELGMFPFSIISGWAGEKLRVYGSFFSPAMWKYIYKRRRKVQMRRQIKDRKIMKLMTGQILFQDKSMRNPILLYVANPLFNSYFFLLKKFIFW